MAHFARVENDIVKEVIVISNEVCNLDYPESQLQGQTFIKEILGKSGFWVQTSYNNNFCKQYAGKDFTYDSDNNVFIQPQPYASWSLNDNFDWQAPVPKPKGDWYWNEQAGEWHVPPLS